MPKIEVSFKKTSRDQRLFNEVDSKEKSEKSEFVKNALEFYINHLKEKSTSIMTPVPFRMLFNDDDICE